MNSFSFATKLLDSVSFLGTHSRSTFPRRSEKSAGFPRCLFCGGGSVVLLRLGGFADLREGKAPGAEKSGGGSLQPSSVPFHV